MQFDANGWLDIATEVDYSANSMSRQGYSIKYLVLHGTAGGSSAQGIGQYFKSTIGGSNPVSSHLIIDQQGNVVQGVPMSLAAFANGVITNGHAAYLPNPSINPNWYTASIEFVKSSTDNSDSLTDIQTQVGFEVIKCICDTYNIPKRAGDANGGIIKHADIDPVNRSRCPGPYPWDALWQYLGGNMPPTPNQLKEAQDCWNSFFNIIGQKPPVTGTSIYQAWLSEWVDSGKQYGPPITYEYNSNDWNGNQIMVQEFAHARCEFRAGIANWYSINGQL
jgi:N-acetyl-anhydromuramyl-L-alanine amidase AmpD